MEFIIQNHNVNINQIKNRIQYAPALCKSSNIERDTFERTTTSNSEVKHKPVAENNISPVHQAAVRAAKIISDDKEIQQALIRMADNEAIVIRTKDDAYPILKKQYESIPDKENLYVLDINPQSNNGMPKSNHLISKWYIDANNLSDNQLITMEDIDFDNRISQASFICESWKQGTPEQKKFQKTMSKIKEPTIPIQQARKIIQDAQQLKTSEAIQQKYTIEELAQAVNTINEQSKKAIKNGGYAAALAKQMAVAVNNAGSNPVTFVIPDDCSLSGSSILCDTIKILSKLCDENKNNTPINIIFSPIVIGDKAQQVIDEFTSTKPLDDNFLMSVNAIRNDGKESFIGALKSFEKVKSAPNYNFSISKCAIQAKHFTETKTYKEIGEENPELQQQLLYLMQGEIDGQGAMFGGFGNCGVMVINPTEEFTINGKKYAGKIPTNSVGYMEVLGQELGVLNDAVEDKKGLFTKGTGRDYRRYCEWEELAHPKNIEDRVPIKIINGTVSLRSA